jgi:outer membrane protein OmpA-like peptidoglycan-associated protein
MKNNLYLITFLAIANFANAQQDAFKWRVGVHGGAGFSNSDISLTAAPNLKDLMYGVSAEYFFNKAWSGRALISAGQVTANDRSFKGANFERGLNAQTRFQDISLMGAFYFDNERNMSEVAQFAPYFTAGIGVTNFNVFADLKDANGALYNVKNNYKDEFAQDGVYETEVTKFGTNTGGVYPNIAVTIPVGLGLKYRVNDRININLEAVAKFALTDYFDDASGSFLTDIPTNYTAAQALATKPNANYTGARGGVQGNDMYGHLGLSVHYNFGLKAVDIIDVPVVFVPSVPTSTGKVTPSGGFGTSDDNQGRVPTPTKTDVSTMPKISDSRKIANYFKTKDTISAAVADIERMRLEVAYINKDLAALDTTANNNAFIQSQSARLVEIRNKAKEYHKFGAGTPQEQEKVKEVNADLQNERKETLVSINILTLPTSDKAKVIDNLKKKDALNDAFITRQESKINELRVENGVAAVSSKPSINPSPIASGGGDKPAKLIETPKKVEPVVAVVETPKKVEPAPKPIETPKKAEPVVAVVETPKKVEPAPVKTAEVIAAEQEVAKMRAEIAAEKAAIAAEKVVMQQKLDAQAAEIKRKDEELKIAQQRTSSTELIKKDKEIDALNKRIAQLENLMANPVAATPAPAQKVSEIPVGTPIVSEPVRTKPTTEAAKTVANREAAKVQLAELKKDIAVKEQQKQKLKENKGALNNQIWFIPNDGSLTPIQMSRLNQVIAFMRENPNANVDLKPFIEPGMRNPDLPYERADNVKNYLMSKGGIALERISVSVAGTGSVQVGKKYVSGRRVEVRFLIAE